MRVPKPTNSPANASGSSGKVGAGTRLVKLAKPTPETTSPSRNDSLSQRSLPRFNSAPLRMPLMPAMRPFRDQYNEALSPIRAPPKMASSMRLPILVPKKDGSRKAGVPRGTRALAGERARAGGETGASRPARGRSGSERAQRDALRSDRAVAELLAMIGAPAQDIALGRNRARVAAADCDRVRARAELAQIGFGVEDLHWARAIDGAAIADFTEQVGAPAEQAIAQTRAGVLRARAGE